MTTMTTPDDLAAAGAWTPESEPAIPAPDGPTLQAVAEAVTAMIAAVN